MSRIQPLPESEAQDKLERTYGRIREMLESDSVPEPFLTYGRVEAFLQDFYMNFKKFVYTDGALDAKTKAILGLAVSSNYGCTVWLDFFTMRLKSLGAEDGVAADVIAVASTNSMYNSFFKFRDMSGSEVFGGMSVGLRAHTFMNTSLDEKTVELINTVISNLNACKPCTSGHVTKSRDLGASDDQLLEAIQCASTMAAGCSFLKAAEA
jgi:lipoyl-dependent peroxiredoxin subunit D